MPSEPTSKRKRKAEPAPLSSARGHIGVNVRNRRKALGLSQAKFSELVPCHPTYVSQIERRVTNFSIDCLERIAIAFGVDAVTLMQPPELRNGVWVTPGVVPKAKEKAAARRRR